MEIDARLLEIGVETKNYNNVKDVVIWRLRDDKIITEEQVKEYTEKWQIIMFKRSWFKRWAEVFLKDKDINVYQMKYVKFEP